MARDPAALQLRLLQTVVEVASERNSTLVMPVPVELLRFFEKMAPGEQQAAPHQLEDTGDREVQQAEAAISKEGLPELGDGAPREAADAEVPPLPDAEVPPLPEEDRPGELPPPKPGPGTTEAA
jgi:hypothetical protein